MGRIDIIEVPKFVLENLYQTLQTMARIHNSYERETDSDRDIMRDLKCIDKLIKDEEITGMERVEFDQL